MRFPRKGTNRIRKSLIPDKPLNDAAPKKHYPSIGKSPANNWRHRWFLGCVTLALFAGAPVLADNIPPSGPVHFPPATAVATAPVTSPVAVPAQVAAPAAPVSPSTVSGDIRDIRGPISIPYTWLWVAYVLGGALLVAILYGFWCAFHRAKVLTKSPFEIALERLEAARALMTADTVREYAFTVSEIIRVYIEKRFNEKIARRTTEEFLFDLVQRTDTPLAKHRRRLEDFLGYCDLMKFARWQASMPELESMHESARVFILETKPQLEAVASAKSGVPSSPTVQPELLHAK